MTKQSTKKGHRMKYKTLSDGTKIPPIGFGTDLVPDGETIIDAVTWAIETGYRLIDNADCYNNQDGVGIAINNCIKNGIVKREDLYITNKVPDWKQGYEETIKCCKESLKTSQLDYFDLYLVHSPLRGRNNWEEKIGETYQAIIDLQKEGCIKSIGVSNFALRHLTYLFTNFSKIRPVINQIELHPEHQQREIVDICQKSYIQLESWGALNQGRIFKNGIFINMANKYGKTPAQIAIRWNLQKGYIPLARSIKKEHIENNFKVFDFEISSEDMQILDNLDGGEWSMMHDDSLFNQTPVPAAVSTPNSYSQSYKMFGFLPFMKKYKKNRRITKYYLFGIPIVKTDKKIIEIPKDKQTKTLAGVERERERVIPLIRKNLRKVA